MTGAAIIACAVALVIALLLWRQSRSAITLVMNDDVTLRSNTLQLSGKPDRVIRKGNTLIPIEKKSGTKVQDSHRIQLGVYFLLMEDIYGDRPPYGIISLAGDREVRVKNTARLRATVNRHIDELRNGSGRATPFPAKCARCGVRSACAFGE